MYENGKNGKIEKVSIIISHGSLEGVYPGLILANGARMEDIDATIFLGANSNLRNSYASSFDKATLNFSFLSWA